MADEKTPQHSDIQLKLIHMNDVQETKTHWLWYPYIPYGKITIIQGDPGEGKTTLVLHLAAALTRGEMLGSEEKREPVTVIYQTAEDGLTDTIKPRLIAANADCSKVLVIDETEQSVSMTDSSCYSCLRNYYNQKYHDDLKRSYVIEFLNRVFSTDSQSFHAIND